MMAVSFGIIDSTTSTASTASTTSSLSATSAFHGGGVGAGVPGGAAAGVGMGARATHTDTTAVTATAAKVPDMATAITVSLEWLSCRTASLAPAITMALSTES